MNINMPSFVCTALDRLNSLGYEAYIVGGCVRDAFLNKTPYDWDITTSAKPQEISDAFSNYKTIDTGIKHGTVSVIIEGEILEITTMRVDGEYSDNRHPDSVSFTENINLDLARRDFTVNAMAYSPLTGVVDPFGGQKDLNDKIIRCVGEPHKRFTEDALRILRGLRFSSTLQFEIENDTANAMNELRELLDNVAAERKRVELLKLLCGADAKRILLTFPQVIFQIIPQLESMYNFQQNTVYHIYDVWGHTVAAVDNVPPQPIYRVVMLFHDMGKPRAYYCDDDGTAHFKGHQSISYEMCLEVLHNLRFSKAEIDEISKMVLHHDIRPQGREDTLLKAARIGADLMKKLYPVFVADAKAHHPAIVPEMLNRIVESEKFLDEAMENNECLSIKQLNVNGKDVAALGFKGKQIGEVLNFLVNEIIKGNVENTKEKLVEYINKSEFGVENCSVEISKRKPNRLKKL